MNFIKKIWNGFKNNILTRAIVGIFRVLFTPIILLGGYGRSIADKIRSYFYKPPLDLTINLVKSALKKLFDTIIRGINTVFNDIVKLFKFVYSPIAFVASIGAIVAEVISDFASKSRENVKKVNTSIKDKLEDLNPKRRQRKIERYKRRLFYGKDAAFMNRNMWGIALITTTLLQIISFFTTFRGSLNFFDGVHWLAPFFFTFVIQGLIVVLSNTAFIKRRGFGPRKAILIFLVCISIFFSYIGISNSVMPPTDDYEKKYNEYYNEYNNVLDEMRSAGKIEKLDSYLNVAIAKIKNAYGQADIEIRNIDKTLEGERYTDLTPRKEDYKNFEETREVENGTRTESGIETVFIEDPTYDKVKGEKDDYERRRDLLLAYMPNEYRGDNNTDRKIEAIGTELDSLCEQILNKINIDSNDGTGQNNGGDIDNNSEVDNGQITGNNKNQHDGKSIDELLKIYTEHVLRYRSLIAEDKLNIADKDPLQEDLKAINDKSKTNENFENNSIKSYDEIIAEILKKNYGENANIKDVDDINADIKDVNDNTADIKDVNDNNANMDTPDADIYDKSNNEEYLDNYLEEYVPDYKLIRNFYKLLLYGSEHPRFTQEVYLRINNEVDESYKRLENIFNINKIGDNSSSEQEDSSLNEQEDSSLNEQEDSSLNEQEDNSLNEQEDSSLNEQEDNSLNELMTKKDKLKDELYDSYSYAINHVIHPSKNDNRIITILMIFLAVLVDGLTLMIPLSIEKRRESVLFAKSKKDILPDQEDVLENLMLSLAGALDEDDSTQAKSEGNRDSESGNQESDSKKIELNYRNLIDNFNEFVRMFEVSPYTAELGYPKKYKLYSNNKKEKKVQETLALLIGLGYVKCISGYEMKLLEGRQKYSAYFVDKVFEEGYKRNPDLKPEKEKEEKEKYIESKKDESKKESYYLLKAQFVLWLNDNNVAWSYTSKKKEDRKKEDKKDEGIN
ncbi:MAG: hypothetical protein IJM37_00115 [Lachnospiraceae bacterium]|nr:hypothetical protein [Lachnospiraceae bacterium]